jgi:hypothetical protein
MGADGMNQCEKETVVEKVWTHKDIMCAVLFVGQSHRCGYILMPEKSPFKELSYDDLPISVHGGLTFKDSLPAVNTSKESIWLGFDCAHSGDTTKFAALGHVWTLEEVAKETEKMAEQFKKLKWKDIVENKLQYMPEWFIKRVKVGC